VSMTWRAIFTRPSYQVETTRRAAEEEGSRLTNAREKAERGFRSAEERSDAAEGEAAALLEAARAAEAIVQHQSVRLSKLEARVQEDQVNIAHMTVRSAIHRSPRHRMPFHSRNEGLADVARHVIGCHLIRETRARNACG